MSPQKLDSILLKTAMIVGRLVLGYLFFTQLWWKAPPTFGCPADFAFAQEVDGKLKSTSGLCDWIGRESVYAQKSRSFFLANLDNKGEPEIALNVSALTRANGAFIDSFIKPNIRWFGYVVFTMESFIALSMILGLFSRLGGLVAIAMSAQLMIGLSGTPGEWEWIYHLMVALSIVMFALAPGRFFGLDVWLRPKLQAAAEKGNGFGKALVWLM